MPSPLMLSKDTLSGRGSTSGPSRPMAAGRVGLSEMCKKATRILRKVLGSNLVSATFFIHKFYKFYHTFVAKQVQCEKLIINKCIKMWLKICHQTVAITCVNARMPIVWRALLPNNEALIIMRIILF